jgi:photosystem II stability/assembly factor-like uncharacterized protein
MYATVDAGKLGGIYRSDDAGESWTRIQTDERLWGRGSDFAEIKTDPKNADIVYSANVVTWSSTDGGKTWSAFRGAPGGDDYHRIWINPLNPQIMLIASDQGAIITVNGGETFSSWYNQPTAQFYHVSTDNAFPYNVYGGQQESGSVGIASRGNEGQISFREWHPVGVEEYGYVAADPLDPNIIYGGKITRYDKRTGHVQNIAPEVVRSSKYRFLRTAPVLFSPANPKTLYFAGNVIFKTQNGGQSWEVISPDLSREAWDIPESVGIYTTEELKKMPRRGVVYTLAPSSINENTLWAGTDDGLIHVTTDGGKTWKNVTPPQVTSWSKVSLLEAGHFDNQTAYAAVNRIRCDDMRPHIYKTHDGGATWIEIVNGLPNDPINAVREDPYRKGMLYAGSERAAHISFDDGAHWQSLRQNMPATSIRDLVIKEDDIVVGTHGRSFWILDNISALRQITAGAAPAAPVLYKPQTAIRVRWNLNTDTPLPQEEPAGENPPDGAMIEYWLPANASGEVTLEITDASGTLVRRYSSRDTLYSIPPNNVPPYWLRRQSILSSNAGMHRWLWDLHYQPLNQPPAYPIAAVYKNTAPNLTSPWVMPGAYTATLRANGTTYTQPLQVRMDPRVTMSEPELKSQHDLSVACYQAIGTCKTLLDEMPKYRNTKTMSPADAAHDNLQTELQRLQKNAAGLMNVLQDVDMAPTTQAQAGVADVLKNLETWKNKWAEYKRLYPQP